MRPQSEVLGVLQPVGGGDPIPLIKPEIIVGRRSSCDICLDFENTSGKHCVFRFVNGVWNVRDLGSTNGTTVNGSRIASEQSIMPEDEVGIAGHLYTIEYDPAGPEAFLSSRRRWTRRSWRSAPGTRSWTSPAWIRIAPRPNRNARSGPPP